MPECSYTLGLLCQRSKKVDLTIRILFLLASISIARDIEEVVELEVLVDEFEGRDLS